MFSLIPWRKDNARLTTVEPRIEHPLARMREEFDHLFERFFKNLGGSDSWDNILSSGVDVDESNNEYIVRAEAPGFEADEFDLQLCGNQLVIRAEHKQEESKGNGHSFGKRQLYRTVTLPKAADFDEVKAKYRSGILELRLPKRPEAQGKRITVTA